MRVRVIVRVRVRVSSCSVAAGDGSSDPANAGATATPSSLRPEGWRASKGGGATAVRRAVSGGSYTY